MEYRRVCLRGRRGMWAEGDKFNEGNRFSGEFSFKNGASPLEGEGREFFTLCPGDWSFSLKIHCNFEV